MQPHPYFGVEHDACAIYAAVSKESNPASNWCLTAIDALTQMAHRAGWLQGRSDGTGLLMDLPREVWAKRLRAAHLDAAIAHHQRRFFVLQTAVSLAERRDLHHELTDLVAQFSFRTVLTHLELVDSGQGLDSVALWDQGPSTTQSQRCFDAIQAIERRWSGILSNFSNNSMVLKVTNDPAQLRDVLLTQFGAEIRPRAVIGHNRFSTNTSSLLARVQPFLGLAHNGEINTVATLMDQMETWGILPVVEGSDSQNVDRLVSAFMLRDGLTHGQALRLALSPSPAQLAMLPEVLQQRWAVLKAFWGPYVQGPAAIVHRFGDSVIAGVDAMGLRPLWLMETSNAFIVSSEPGVTDSEQWIAEPRILGPGEMIELRWARDEGVQIVSSESLLDIPAPASQLVSVKPLSLSAAETPPHWQYVADGWRRDDQHWVQYLAENGSEPIGSLGFDGPLAALAHGIVNISDYLHETVAVVTNPALDREREMEHFDLTTVLGSRPEWTNAGHDKLAVLPHPWLMGSDLENLMAEFKSVAVLRLQVSPPQDEVEAAEELAEQALQAVQDGATLLVLDDADGYDAFHSVTLDPSLATAAADAILRKNGLRRRVGIVVRSGMIRHLHDAVVLLGLGANALSPTAIWALASPEHPEKLLAALNAGVEKVLSTMGIHELRGYGRLFSAIGLPGPVADLLGVVSFARPHYEPWQERRAELQRERLALIEDRTARLLPISRATTHVYKPTLRLIEGVHSAEEFSHDLRDLRKKHPIAIRHLLGYAPSSHAPLSKTTHVSLDVGTHSLPFVIGSMSFGSQGETAFRAYAEAARQLNMVAMNGEGGEIPDMIGRYYSWRGHQIASGRFGVNTNLLNGAAFLEIKIGQGAKPGEGGHLPGKKVSLQVAASRSANPGIDLISPSNNHDLYSIEDLQELIDELRAANPQARIVVKVPVVPNIGTIAVGIVKAGADVVNLSGFDGGTGAARQHALRHVGLPADVGVPLVHSALSAAGLRDQVEIWCDGGMRSADDVVQMVLLGADRVGFATMAMIALGCTVCRSCQQDTCHVGITTQIGSIEEAKERGLKRFFPQDQDQSVARLTQFFTALASAVADRLRDLGLTDIRHAVGQWSLLSQTEGIPSLNFMGFLEELNTWQSAQLNVAGQSSSTTIATTAHNRLIGVGVSGHRTRHKDHLHPLVRPVDRVAGQGFGAFLSPGVTLIARGGAQDGVGKGATEGSIAVLKARRPTMKGSIPQWIGGHVGKGVGYGAQGGRIVVQGAADARAGIRLSGADLIILGQGVPSPRQSSSFWNSAVIKGFGFEYMTRGRGLVLGDPGPWLASGMTGGVVYLKHDDQQGLSIEFLRTRLARGARVSLVPLGSGDRQSVQELLHVAQTILRDEGHIEGHAALEELADDPGRWFVKLIPLAQQSASDISTE